MILCGFIVDIGRILCAYVNACAKVIKQTDMSTKQIVNCSLPLMSALDRFRITDDTEYFTDRPVVRAVCLFVYLFCLLFYLFVCVVVCAAWFSSCFPAVF